jgi:hypothetical protein
MGHDAGVVGLEGLRSGWARVSVRGRTSAVLCPTRNRSPDVRMVDTPTTTGTTSRTRKGTEQMNSNEETDQIDDDTEGHMPRVRFDANKLDEADTNAANTDEDDTEGHMPRIKPSADDSSR